MKTIIQFGFLFFSPKEKGWNPVIDCRVLRNPYTKGVPDEELKQRVKAQPGFRELVAAAAVALRSNDTVYVGCAYGRHRSGAVAQEVAKLTGAKIVKMEPEE